MRGAWIGGLLLACGGGGGGADGGAGTNACGAAGTARGAECTGLDDCGAGAANFKEVSFCEHCPWRPDTHVCEAGVCRALALENSNIGTAFGVPDAATGAKSFIMASINPTMADGTRVTCAALLGTCDRVMNRRLNTGNSRFLNFTEPAAPGFAYQGQVLADVGTERLLLVLVTSEAQGKGAVMATGCAEGIEVRAGETTQVSLTLQ